MAIETVPDPTQTTTWTASAQAASSKLKIVKLLELGENAKGRFARVEFEDESSRPLYLLTIADAWHSIFDTLEPKLCREIRRHFNRRLPKITLPDGSRKEFLHSSFATETRGPRRQFLGQCYFDLAAYQEVSGTQAGLAIAREFLELKETRSGGCWTARLHLMLDDMQAAEGKRERDAVRAFLRVIEEMVQFSARHANFQAFIDAEVERVKQNDQRMEAFQAEQKKEFIERMKLAREARRQRSIVANTGTMPCLVDRTADTAASPHVAEATQVAVKASMKVQAPIASTKTATRIPSQTADCFAGA